MTTKCCGTCFFFRKIPVRKCCVNPPRAEIIGVSPEGPQVVTFWPSPSEHDLCKDWEPDVNASN